MSEPSFSLQPSHENATDLGLGAMDLSMDTSGRQFWMDPSHTQAVAGRGAQTNGVKREPEWERQQTVAPNSVSPPEQGSSVRTASGSPEKEDDTTRAAKLERESSFFLIEPPSLSNSSPQTADISIGSLLRNTERGERRRSKS